MLPRSPIIIWGGSLHCESEFGTIKTKVPKITISAFGSWTHWCLDTVRGTIIIHALAYVGTGLHCTNLGSAHCPALADWKYAFDCTDRSKALKPPTRRGLSALHNTCPLTGLQLYPYLLYSFLACTHRSLSLLLLAVKRYHASGYPASRLRPNWLQ